MAKNTKQIALIQHRRGKLSELPKQLNEGEFGLALDTNELFIGNSTNPALAERINKDEFPYGNIQILTEFTDNLHKITYRYISNTDVMARLPIVVTGTVIAPSVVLGTSIIINGIDVEFDTQYSLDGLIDKINSVKDLDVKAFRDDNSHLVLITTASELTLEDGTTFEKGNVERLGFGVNEFATVAALPVERPLQQVLDDQVSVKSFGAIGDGEIDDSDAIYNGVLSLNKAGDAPQYFRTLSFPAGTYKVQKTIPLPKGTHLKGEGYGRTILKEDNFGSSLFMTMDSNFITPSLSDYYGKGSELPVNITVEDLTIDVSESGAGAAVTLGPCETVVFRNVEFKGSEGTVSVRIEPTTNAIDFKYIVFDNCKFVNGSTGIYVNGNVDHLIVKNCYFESFTGTVINASLGTSVLTHSLVDGNVFTKCVSSIDPLIMLGENTSFVRVVNNRFDSEIVDVEEFETIPYESLSEKNYTDILDPNTDSKKLLQFKYTQPSWEYIDYLMNPNGEYLIKPEYDYIMVDGEEVPRPLTNGLVIEQGTEENGNTVTVRTSKFDGGLNVNSSGYGNLELGKNTDGVAYDAWVSSQAYAVGERVQMVGQDNLIYVYEATRAGTGFNPQFETSYWNLIGTYDPKIITYKPLDLNGNYVTSSRGNITFKTDGSNYLRIDDTANQSGTSYAERIAAHDDAIPNVDYVLTIAQSTFRKTFDFDTFSETGEPKRSICYFDPEIYGDFINLNYVNVNVRSPFYPVIGAMENALDWRSGLKYYQGEVVKAYVDEKENKEFELYKLTGGQWVKIENVTEYTKEQVDVNGPLPTLGQDGDYGIVFDDDDEDMNLPFADGEYKMIFTKVNGKWLKVPSDEWRALSNQYADSQPNPVFANNSVFGIVLSETVDEETGQTVLEQVQVPLTLNDGESYQEAFVRCVNAALPEDSKIKASVVENSVRVSSESGPLKLFDVTYSPLATMGFNINPVINYVIPNGCMKLVYTYDTSTPATDYFEGSCWLKSTGTLQYYKCLETNLASSSFMDDLGNNGSLPKWERVKTELNGEPIKDVKYVSILAENTNAVERRMLFLKDAIDITRRDIHSTYEPDWVTGTEYHTGDRVAYENRYWECLSDHTSDTPYDLHNKDLWLCVQEEGFNYHFDFERNIYEIDENDNILPMKDIIVDYNFSDYHLYLMLYDADGNLMKMYNDGQSSSTKNIQLCPGGCMLLTVNYIRS